MEERKREIEREPDRQRQKDRKRENIKDSVGDFAAVPFPFHFTAGDNFKNNRKINLWPYFAPSGVYTR